MYIHILSICIFQRFEPQSDTLIYIILIMTKLVMMMMMTMMVGCSSMAVFCYFAALFQKAKTNRAKLVSTDRLEDR